MKRVYLLCFRGTGFADKYREQPGLIQAGHVGLLFEDEEIILGFSPTQEAIEAAGGAVPAMQILKAERGSLEGKVQDDTSYFTLARELASRSERTTVWQIEIEVGEEEYSRIYRQIYEWYNQNKVFMYSFPENVPGAHNCATFPELLGLPLPEPTGYISEYINAMKADPSFREWEGF